VVGAVAPPGSVPIAQLPTRPVPPTLMIADARSYAQTIVRQRSHRHPRLSLDCLRVSAWKLQCDLDWSTGTSSYTATGTFWNYLQGATAYWWYDFKGRVTTYRCNTRGRWRTVRHRFRWR